MKINLSSNEIGLLSTPIFSNYKGENAFIFQGKVYQRQKKPLGTGGWGSVFCFESDDDSKVAVKFEHPSEKKYSSGKEFLREADFYQKVYHLGIFSGNVEDDESPHYILLPYIEGKTLYHLTFRSEKEVALWWIKTADAINQLHQAHQIMHCDLKSDNVMIGLRSDGVHSDVAKKAYLIDFGLASDVGKPLVFSLEDTDHNRKAYSQYAPEIFHRGKQKIKCKAHPSQDIYSLGVLLLSLYQQYWFSNDDHVLRAKQESSFVLVYQGMTDYQVDRRWTIPKSIYMLIIGFFSQVPRHLMQNAFLDSDYEHCPPKKIMSELWKTTALAAMQARSGELEVEQQRQKEVGKFSVKKAGKIAGLKALQSNMEIDYPYSFERCVEKTVVQFPALKAGVFSHRTKTTLDELVSMTAIFH